MVYMSAGLALMGVQPAFADEASNPAETEPSDVSSDLGVWRHSMHEVVEKT